MHLGLFTKLFLSFWLVTLLAMAGWKFSFQYFEARYPVRSEVVEGGPPPTRAMAEIVFRLQRGAMRNMERFVTGARRRGGCDVRAS